MISAGASSSFPVSSGASGTAAIPWELPQVLLGAGASLRGGSGMRRAGAPSSGQARPRLVPGADVYIARKRVGYPEDVDRSTQDAAGRGWWWALRLVTTGSGSSEGSLDLVREGSRSEVARHRRGSRGSSELQHSPLARIPGG